MVAHAKKLDDYACVMNVGFGCGIVDGAIQANMTPPRRHVIVEPHPDGARKPNQRSTTTENPLGFFDSNVDENFSFDSRLRP